MSKNLKDMEAVLDEKTLFALKKAQILRVYDNGRVVFLYDRVNGEEEQLKQVGKKMADKLVKEGFYWLKKKKDGFVEYERMNGRFYFEMFRLGIKRER